MGAGFWGGLAGAGLLLLILGLAIVSATESTCHKIQLQALHAGHPEIAEWIKGSEACQ